jgi:hypothetical protein
VRAKKYGVRLFGEHHEVGSFRSARVDNGVAEIARDDASIREPESLLPLSSHTELLEERREPGEFASRVSMTSVICRGAAVPSSG